MSAPKGRRAVRNMADLRVGSSSRTIGVRVHDGHTSFNVFGDASRSPIVPRDQLGSSNRCHAITPHGRHHVSNIPDP